MRWIQDNILVLADKVTPLGVLVVAVSSSARETWGNVVNYGCDVVCPRLLSLFRSVDARLLLEHDQFRNRAVFSFPVEFLGFDGAYKKIKLVCCALGFTCDVRERS